MIIFYKHHDVLSSYSWVLLALSLPLDVKIQIENYLCYKIKYNEADRPTQKIKIAHS